MSLLRRFLKDESGIAYVYFLVALPAFLGVALLAIDIGRGNNLHFDLQKAVDSLALAAAAELDGSPGAQARATARLTGLLANRTRFSDGGEVVLTYPGNVQKPRFLKDLPASDDDLIPASMEATTDAEAEFVEVTAKAQPYTSIFPISLALGQQTVNIAATAVAGFGSAVCDFTPMFICNPFENSATDTIFSMVGSPNMIELRQQGGGSGQPAPGNFGFLESPGNPGANELREAFAKVKPAACFSRRQVTTKPGFAATITDALNVRFDIYDGPMSGKKSGSTAADYRPARNVRKGYEPGSGGGQAAACNADLASDPTQFMALPRDATMTDIQGGALGAGDWDFEGYWNVNFPGQAGNFPSDPDTGVQWSNSNPPPRFKLYRYEIANGLVPEPSVGGETGAPACSSATPSDDPDRRLVFGAIINCDAEFQGQAGKITAAPIAFASFFLTEALEKGGGGGERDNQTIRVELVDVTGPGGNGSLLTFERNEPQLYR